MRNMLKKIRCYVKYNNQFDDDTISKARETFMEDQEDGWMKNVSDDGDGSLHCKPC